MILFIGVSFNNAAGTCYTGTAFRNAGRWWRSFLFRLGFRLGCLLGGGGGFWSCCRRFACTGAFAVAGQRGANGPAVGQRYTRFVADVMCVVNRIVVYTGNADGPP